MNENHELPKINEIKTYETNFFHVIDMKDWKPNFSSGPFLPINSGGEGNLPYKMTDIRKSTIIDYTQEFMSI